MALVLPYLKQSGHLDQIHITICNVGSRKLSKADDYASQIWQIFAPNLTIYGLDADADACEAAHSDLESRNVTWTERHIPIAISNSIGEQTLYVTKHPMCSSLYPPNEAFLSRFEGLPELVNLDFTVELETDTLDNFFKEENQKNIDFLQIDVQGADLDVLRGAMQLLPSVMAIQIEVEFAELYLNQPLFPDIDSFLKKQGFSLFDLACSRCRRLQLPIVSGMHPGQLLWGEAYYLRDPMQGPHHAFTQSPEQLLKLACIADAMNFSDYSLELLGHLTLTYGQDNAYNFADPIVMALQEVHGLSLEEVLSLPLIVNLKPFLTSDRNRIDS